MDHRLTPYQAEISQGRLEAQLLFQTVVADLTGLPVACTSLLDEATAVAEAVLLMARAHRGPGAPVLLDSGLHPQRIEVASSRAEALGIDVEIVCAPAITADGAPLTGAVLAHTTSRGLVQDLAGAVAAVHARGGLVAVDADPLALTLLTEPGTVGADIAVGTAQACWRSSRPSTRSTTVPRAWCPSPSTCTAGPSTWPSAPARSGSPSSTRSSSTR